MLQIPVKYDRRSGIGDEIDIAVCLSASDWRGLNRNQTQNAILEVYEGNNSKGSDNLTKINEELFEGKPFNYVSLFSGIGGFEQALNKLGGECVLASEIDKFANQSYEVLYGHPTAGDITKIDAKDVPDHDLLVGGFPCFAAGTLITTAEGIKPIEEVRKGDKVLTHTNTFKDVVVPMMKRKKGIYELKVQGSPTTLITEEHPVYVREMFRTYNTENGKRTNRRNWSEPKWIEAKDLKEGVHFVGMSENNNASNPRNITKEEAWLIGRYVADGYIRNNKRNGRENSYNNQVIYCIGKSKLSEFKQNVRGYYVGISEDSTVYKGRIINERLTELCLEAGRGSENKRVPGYILDLPNDLLETFLEGYLSGDGCVIKGVYQATSVSRQLTYGLGQVVQKLYKTPYSITYTKRPKTTVIEGRTVNQRDTWMIRFRKENRKQQDGVYIDGMLWMPIRKITYDADFEGNVYNFEVEGDNSYVANNLTVHNCQAFSVAGKRLGFDDTRGTLFFEVARIAREKQPKAILLENVKGLVGHDKGRTLDTIVQTLNDIGYTVDFEVLNSKYFGVPQNRERIFIIAVRDDLVTPEPWSIEGNTVVPKGKRRISEYEGVKTFNFDWPEQAEVTTRLRDILEPLVDEKYYLDEEKTARLVAQLEGQDDEPRLVGGIGEKNFGKQYRQGNRIYDADAVAMCLHAQPVGNAGGNSYLYKVNEEPKMLGHVDLKGHDAIKRVYSAESVGPTLTTMGGGHREPKIAEPQEIANVGNISYCIDANYSKGISPGSIGKGRRTHVEEQKPRYRIRKLTPRECFRLQNFSDDAFDKLKEAGISDSQLYKMAGNAVTVSVVKAISERLLKYL